MKISVCIATYNGQDFIFEQINSILTQINEDDEIILVDDSSTDNTINIVKSFKDNRIKIFRNERNRGYIYSFSKALSLSSNDIIFLSDQDDIWMPGRVELITKELFETGSLVVSSNFTLLESNNSFKAVTRGKLKASDSTKNLKNIIGIFRGNINYFGCTMAFKREIFKIILPIPSYVRSHDLWIAMASNLASSNLHIDKDTLIRRIHSNNATNSNRNILQKLLSRIIFAVSLVCLIIRIKSINTK